MGWGQEAASAWGAASVRVDSRAQRAGRDSRTGVLRKLMEASSGVRTGRHGPNAAAHEHDACRAPPSRAPEGAPGDCPAP
ncbi:hypothetical protein KH5H1_25600 [Corallococcus caeni]|nr:hypothetical protein KH5H1_25600 [Corallococcus sp. KH5-1]